MSHNLEKVVSVIIPTYGRPTLLKRAIDSVLNQSYNEIEIIVVDDNNPGTTEREETEELLKNYATNKKVIYIKHEFNKNGAAARNTGLSIAKGVYVTFLDDDDEMLPNRVSECVKEMDSLDKSWGACYTDFNKYKANGVIDTCGENRSGDLYLQALMRSIYIGSGSNLFLRMDLVKNIGGYDEDFRRNQDLEFMARFLENSKLSFLPQKTLIIHYEDKERLKTKKNGKEAYNHLISIDDFYLGKFRDRIEKLPKKQKEKVYKYIALERFRYSIKHKMIKDGVKNCIKNHVDIITFIRYCFYMLNRQITKKAYGFHI